MCDNLCDKHAEDNFHTNCPLHVRTDTSVGGCRRLQEEDLEDVVTDAADRRQIFAAISKQRAGDGTQRANPDELD